MPHSKRWNRAGVALAIGLALALLGMAVYRAAYVALTYDEAYTYLWYAKDLTRARIIEIYADCYANNHWLNTVLIKLAQTATHAYFNELVIRLPSLLFYVVYLALAVYLLAKREIGLGGFSLLALSYYANDFFSQARGYGMAACLLLMGLLLYRRWRAGGCESHHSLTLCLACFALACLAQTLSMLVFAAVGIVIGVHLLREKKLGVYLKRQWGWLLPIALIVRLMAWYHIYNVAAPGKPLPDSPPASLWEAFVGNLVRLYAPGGWPTTAFGVLLCVFAGVAVICFFGKVLRSRFVLAALLHILIWAAAFVATGNLPNLRCLLVSLPLLALALSEMAGWYGQYFREKLAPRMGEGIKRFLCAAPGLLLTALLLAALLPQARWLNAEIAERSRDRALAYELAGRGERLDLDREGIEPYPIRFYRDRILFETGYDIRPEWNW